MADVGAISEKYTLDGARHIKMFTGVCINILRFLFIAVYKYIIRILLQTVTLMKKL